MCLVLGPVGSLALGGAVGDGLATRADLHVGGQLAALAAVLGAKACVGEELCIGKDVEVQRLDEGGQPLMRLEFWEILLLPSAGPDLGRVEPQDVAEEANLFGRVKIDVDDAVCRVGIITQEDALEILRRPALVQFALTGQTLRLVMIH